MLALIASLFAVSNGQSSSNCVYRQGGLELDLLAFKGKFLSYEEDNFQWTYTICSDSLSCLHNSVSVNAMVEGHAVGINECHYWGIYNESTQPFYDFAVASWIFNYSNGEPCPDQSQQQNRTTTIAYNCNPLVQQPFIVDVFTFDGCNALIQVEWEGACQPAPPPNEHCEFRYGFQTLNLSSIQGQSLTFTDDNNLAWKFSPCSNNLNCTTSHGTKLSVMSEVNDPSGQCIKFLGVWSGDVIPFYDRTIFGQDYWDFFWADGEECGEGGPLEILNVRYYCNPKIAGAQITKAGGSGPCQFRIEVDTNLACANASDQNSFKQTEKLVQRLNKDIFTDYEENDIKKDAQQLVL
mmetsp:Transcript_22818/g.20052  ORF Transcript_22818/g.20052 Transcript_22818/m.20052 type:complete len:351 (-) Transcript_22818:99-1151(-)